MARYATHRPDDRMAAQVDEIGQLARPLASVEDLAPLLRRIGSARVVQIGEASHGTAEFYRWRAELTRRLIEDGRARFVAVEGDWPDCEAVTAWLLDEQDDRPATRVLEAFERWPTWWPCSSTSAGRPAPIAPAPWALG